MKLKNEKYGPTNACVHAAAEVITGDRPTEIGSTQTTFKRCLFSSIKNDPTLKLNMQEAVLESGLNKKADTLGEEYLSKLSNSNSYRGK